MAEAFILQYYASAISIPPLLIVQHEVAPALEQALSARRDGHVDRGRERRDTRRRRVHLDRRRPGQAAVGRA